MKEEVFYMLLYPNGDYVALDQASGGYPYNTDSFSVAKKWKSRKEAENYPTIGEIFRLVECKAVFTELQTIDKFNPK